MAERSPLNRRVIAAQERMVGLFNQAQSTCFPRSLTNSVNCLRKSTLTLLEHGYRTTMIDRALATIEAHRNGAEGGRPLVMCGRSWAGSQVLPARDLAAWRGRPWHGKYDPAHGSLRQAQDKGGANHASACRRRLNGLAGWVGKRRTRMWLGGCVSCLWGGC